MKRILITGGTGFFGKSILDYFSRHDGDCEFTILSRHGFKTADLADLKDAQHDKVFNPSDPINPRLKIAPRQLLGDVRSFDLPANVHFDYVIHAATPARVDVPDDGAYVPAVVTSDTDVSRLQVTFDGEAPVEWTTVLKASGGARLTGSPWQRHCAVRVISGADGDECQICKARGFIFYVQ